MFHSREATDDQDKVYALLGMSSDGHIPESLSPDYQVTWKELLCRLCKYIMGERTSVEVWHLKKSCVIRSKSCVLGSVQEVKCTGELGDQVVLGINLAAQGMRSWARIYRDHRLQVTFPTPAKVIQERDVLYLLQESSTPMIVRPCEDYWAIIVIFVPIPGFELADMSLIEVHFAHDFLGVWD